MYPADKKGRKLCLQSTKKDKSYVPSRQKNTKVSSKYICSYQTYIQVFCQSLVGFLKQNFNDSVKYNDRQNQDDITMSENWECTKLDVLNPQRIFHHDCRSTNQNSKNTKFLDP